MGKNKLTSTNKVINSELTKRQNRRKKKKKKKSVLET